MVSFRPYRDGDASGVAALVGGVHELHEVRQVPELRQHGRVVGDVVTAVP